MKKLLIIISVITLSISFFGCKDKNQTLLTKEDTGVERQVLAEKDLPKGKDLIEAKVMKIYDNSILVCDISEKSGSHSVYMISNDIPVYGKDILKNGDIIEIGYGGFVEEIFPASPCDVSYIKIKTEGNDLVGFYEKVIDDLYNVDSGLNPNGGTFAFNFDKLTNITDAQKSSLLYIIGLKYNVETVTGNYYELCENGYIDKDKNYFENGMLFDFSVSSGDEDRFVFNASKWRSGLGAYFFCDCEAVKGDDGYTYTVGSQAIS